MTPLHANLTVTFRDDGYVAVGFGTAPDGYGISFADLVDQELEALAQMGG